jgi:hypothetical protein
MPYSSVASELVASHVPAELLGFRCTLRTSGDGDAWIRVVGELDLATSPSCGPCCARLNHVRAGSCWTCASSHS